jgi:hypothetical protein
MVDIEKNASLETLNRIFIKLLDHISSQIRKKVQDHKASWTSIIHTNISAMLFIFGLKIVNLQKKVNC